jgi:hypothetical protein
MPATASTPIVSWNRRNANTIVVGGTRYSSALMRVAPESLRFTRYRPQPPPVASNTNQTTAP